jgi:uncharacterized membrane protein YqiK
MSDEPTHKLVNGKRVDLTEEEKVAIKADWELGRKRQAERAEAKAARKLQRDDLLKRLGISDEEARLLGEKL